MLLYFLFERKSSLIRAILVLILGHILSKKFLNLCYLIKYRSIASLYKGLSISKDNLEDLNLANTPNIIGSKGAFHA
ncbi:MAG: hypothetical protein QXM32_07025 [Nitrososphaerota archaeon]